MTLADELHDAIVKLSGPREVFDSRERWLARGSRAAGISNRAAKAIFYREWPDPRASIVDSVRAALARLETKQEASARDEIEALCGRIAVLESRLASIDEEFFSASIDALRTATHRNRRATD